MQEHPFSQSNFLSIMLKRYRLYNLSFQLPLSLIFLSEDQRYSDLGNIILCRTEGN